MFTKEDGTITNNEDRKKILITKKFGLHFLKIFGDFWGSISYKKFPDKKTYGFPIKFLYFDNSKKQNCI